MREEIGMWRQGPSSASRRESVAVVAVKLYLGYFCCSILMLFTTLLLLFQNLQDARQTLWH